MILKHLISSFVLPVIGIVKRIAIKHYEIRKEVKNVDANLSFGRWFEPMLNESPNNSSASLSSSSS